MPSQQQTTRLDREKIHKARFLQEEDWRQATSLERKLLSAYDSLPRREEGKFLSKAIARLDELTQPESEPHIYLLAFHQSIAELLRQDVRDRLKRVPDTTTRNLLTALVLEVSWERVGRLYADILLQRLET